MAARRTPIHDREVPEVDLLSPLTIRGRDAPQPDRDVADVPVLARPTAWPNDWHLVHLGSRAVGGVALVMVEATAVTRGRPDHARRHGHLERRARRAAGPDRPVRPQPGGGRRHPARPRRPQGELRPAVEGGREPQDARARGLDGRRPQPDPVQRGRPVPVAARRGRDRRRRRRLRGRRAGAPRRRLPRHRDPLGPRLPAARVPLAAEQPARRRVRRQPGEPDAAGPPRRRAAAQA